MFNFSSNMRKTLWRMNHLVFLVLAGMLSVSVEAYAREIVFGLEMRSTSSAEVFAALQEAKRTVKGTVRDADGEPIPGASVVVKGTQVGVATDIDGRFEIRVDDKPGLTFVVSFVGMKNKEVVVGKNEVLVVVLESDTKALDEVVVTGFQTISKERATGSFDVISTEQLSRPASDLSSRLVGGDRRCAEQSG